MNKPSYSFQFSSILSVLFILIFTIGCTKEKAEAVKMAGTSFQTQAVTALNQIKNLFRQSVSMPVEGGEKEIERVARDIEEAAGLGPKELTFLLKEGEIDKGALNIIDKEFGELEARYYLFADMFRSLPSGTFFSKEAVKKAELHTINLTLEFIKFADFLNRYPVQFSGRRTLILERIADEKKIEDANIRRRNLKITAQALLELRRDEARAKEDAILQCLKAAEAGRLLSNLIRDYESLNVQEIVTLTGGTLGFIAEISEGNQDVNSLVKRYKTIETTIMEDPYWKELFKIKIGVKTN